MKRSTQRTRRSTTACSFWRVAAISLGSIACVPLAVAAELINFDLQSGTAETTLNEFAHQARLRHLIDVDRFVGLKTNAVHGTYTREAALKAFLKNSGIVGTIVGDDVDFGTEPTKSPPTTGASTARASRPSEGPASPENDVTVTGSHIRGPGWTPVTMEEFSAADIRDSGAMSVDDFLHRQPNIFGAGATQDTHFGAEAQANSGVGSALNIHGLGSAGTLVLIDGQRSAPSGSNADFADILGIPESAIIRVDLLADGASAAYGSDAIGGVVNFIMRDGSEPTETFARFYRVTRGSEYQGTLYQTFPLSWSTGQLVLTVEGLRQTALAAMDRGFITSDTQYGGGHNFDNLFAYPPNITNFDRTRTFGVLHAASTTPGLADLREGVPNPQDQYQDADALPSQQRIASYLRIQQTVNEWFDLKLSGFFSRRKAQQRTGGAMVQLLIPSTSPYYVDVTGDKSPIQLFTNTEPLLGSRTTVADIAVYNATAEADFHLSGDRQISVIAHSAQEKAIQITRGSPNIDTLENAVSIPGYSPEYNPYYPAANLTPTARTAMETVPRFDTRSLIYSVAATMDGPAWSWYAGTAKAAFGIEYRGQSFSSRSAEGVATALDNNYLRHIWAGFVELSIPVYATALQKVEITLSARGDHYSDFGMAFAPRGVVRWDLSDALTLSASYDESIRAPTQPNLDTSQNTVVQTPVTDPASPTGEVNVLVKSGNSADLREERAYTGRLGVHLNANRLPSVKWQANVDYFNSHYSGRIQRSEFSTNTLIDPKFTGLINRHPTSQDIANACANGQYYTTSNVDCLTSNPSAIVDVRLANIDTWETQGIDFLSLLKWDTSLGSLLWRIEGTYFLNFTEIYSPHAPKVSLLNTQHNPPRLRLTHTVGISRDAFGLYATLNHTNRYRDTEFEDNRPVASWTTLDLTLKYTFGTHKDDPPHGETVILVGVQNVSDKKPPFLENHEAQLGYDPESVDPTGRMIGINVSRKW